jgi:phosphoribosylanthranilate isomerase
MASEGPADVVLLDAPNPGSGRVFDWCEVSGALDGVRLLLAGGLTPDNVAEAIRRVRPWGVDVSTGVETAPGSGRKDPRKLRRFIQAARAASAALEHRGSPNGGIGHQPYDWQAEGA